jgi:hypothetical protein
MNIGAEYVVDEELGKNREMSAVGYGDEKLLAVPDTTTPPHHTRDTRGQVTAGLGPPVAAHLPFANIFRTRSARADRGLRTRGRERSCFVRMTQGRSPTNSVFAAARSTAKGRSLPNRLPLMTIRTGGGRTMATPLRATHFVVQKAIRPVPLFFTPGPAADQLITE